MADGSPRVAVLARAGEACERLNGALRDAGAEVVLVADPLDADPAQVRDAAPQAILVALDAGIEDAIERYEDVLSDPAYMVIFEEAEQAVLRSGWDAARWLRHLTAKLHRHGDVLPPGAELDEELHPTPGPLQSASSVVDFERAIVAFTDEAQQHAGEVPSDSSLDVLLGRSSTDAVPPVSGVDEAKASADDDTASGQVLELIEFDSAPEPTEEIADDGLAFEGLAFDAGPALQSESPLPHAGITAPAAGIEEFLAERIAATPEIPDDAEADAGPEASLSSVDTGGVDIGGLSLANDDAPVTATGKPAGEPTPAADLDTFGSGLSLADPGSYGHGPLRGAVLIEAGLGGPDAVRQLLAAIPEGFPRPILIRLPLEGGRYDRLVKQMTRATTLPVVVAEEGRVALPGQVHFVPPGLGFAAVASKWTFEAVATEVTAQVLPADDSAVLFLSGADAALVDRVTGAGWAGGLVLGQTPDDSCYDPQAATAAIAAGAGYGTPAELAARLLERWPPPGHPSSEDSSGMLQP